MTVTGPGPSGRRLRRIEDSLLRGGLVGIALVGLATLALTLAGAVIAWLVTLLL